MALDAVLTKHVISAPIVIFIPNAMFEIYMGRQA